MLVYNIIIEVLVLCMYACMCFVYVCKYICVCCVNMYVTC